ncbi:MAG: bifunctional nuclease family protein [Acidimicrobiales bacterium]|nr:bifunctional nuclease family protein [Acidimicrobiales bacterium]
MTGSGDDQDIELSRGLEGVQVEIESLKVELPDIYPKVTLREVDAPRRELTFSIGTNEGIALSIALSNIETPKPFTHQLLDMVLKEWELSLESIFIGHFDGKSYSAELIISSSKGSRRLSCRPSDALVLATLQSRYVPIVIDANLLS